MKIFLLKIYYIVLVIKDYIASMYNKVISAGTQPPSVRTIDDTLEKIVNEGCSVSRYGDGEFALMQGRNLIFQPYCPKLDLRLREIIKSSKENHIICIPGVFERVDWCTEEAGAYWKKYLAQNRSKIYKLIELKNEYYDTQVTRLYIDHKDKSKSEERFEAIKRLWCGRDVVIVEGEQSRLGISNNLFDHACSIKRIICPPVDAFARYEEILNEVKKQDKSKLILIALGPTATVLAYDLSVVGYQAMDIGHIDIEYEWFLQKAAVKCPVKNKYIGEVAGGSNVDQIHDTKYESEIIARITY